MPNTQNHTLNMVGVSTYRWHEVTKEIFIVQARGQNSNYREEGSTSMKLAK